MEARPVPARQRGWVRHLRSAPGLVQLMQQTSRDAPEEPPRSLALLARANQHQPPIAEKPERRREALRQGWRAQGRPWETPLREQRYPPRERKLGWKPRGGWPAHGRRRSQVEPAAESPRPWPMRRPWLSQAAVSRSGSWPGRLDWPPGSGAREAKHRRLILTPRLRQGRQADQPGSALLLRTTESRWHEARGRCWVEFPKRWSA